MWLIAALLVGLAPLGAPASAQQGLPPIAAQPIGRWLVKIPVPADTGMAGLLRDYLAPSASEATILPVPGDPVRGPWTEGRGDSTGALDFNRVFEGSTEHTVAYAHVYLAAPEERDLRLLLSSDDDVQAILNGQTVWVHEVARGLGTATDTVDVRLARGWNTLLVKVRNRTGGFGLRVSLARAPGGPGLGGLRTALSRPAGLTGHLHPAPEVAVGPVHVRGPLLWRRDALVAHAMLPVTAWGADTLRRVRVRVRQGDDVLAEDSFPALVPGRPDSLRAEITFARLRRSALGESRIEGRASWDGGSGKADVGDDPGQLLRLAGGRLDLGFGPIDVHGQRVDRFATRLMVPPALGGRTVELLPRGLGPTASYVVNRSRSAWSGGRVPLCSPCRTGDTLDVELEPDPRRPVWLAPEARADGPGFAEYADGYGYARRLAGETPALERPDPAAWLRALGRGDDSYTKLVQRYAGFYASLARRIRRDTLFLVGNSHIDAAWLWPWSETRDVIRDTWRTSLKLASIFPGYTFAASAAAYYAAVDRLEPTLGDSLRRAVRDGSWTIVGGWWLEPDLNLPSGESLVRQGLYGQRWFERHYGRRAKVAWTPDSFGYPWTLPQILLGQGFDAFVTQKLRWNDSTDFPHDAFRWEGPDGSRLFTYVPYGYDSHLQADQLIHDRVANRDKTGLHDQMVLYGVGDHGGGPTIDMLERAEDLRRVPTFPSMVYAGPEKALDAIRAEAPDSAFPLWRDELYLEYHRGTYTTQAWMKRRNRRSEARLQTAEALAALDTAAYPRTALEGAWHQVLFNQFHDLLPGSGIREIYTHAMARYDSAWTTLDSLDARSMADLAARMDTRGAGRAVVVFNPLGWARGGRVAVPPAPGSGGDSTWITVDSVPALGARVIHLPRDTMSASERAAPEPSAGSGWIQNGLLRVRVDTTDGEITSLRELPSGREALAPGERGNVLQLFDDQPEQWDAWNLVDWKRHRDVTRVTSLDSRADARRAEIRITRRWGSSTFRQTLVLQRGSPVLEIRNDVDWHETHKLLKVAFPLAVRADSATYEIPYGTIGRSGSPRTQAERAKFEVPGQRWADVSGEGRGVSLLDRDKYGWDYHGHVLRLSLLRSPTWPDSLADRGRQRFRFEIYPHEGDWSAAGVERRAAAYNVPLVAAAERRHAGPLGRAWSFASATPAGVHIAWLKRAEESDAYVLRLVEWHGEASDAAVTVACPIGSATKTNLLEDPGDAVSFSGRTARLRLRPYEIATLLVSCAAAR
jgi:alpha-mannosidase